MSHNPERSSDVLELVRARLNEGKPREALDLLRRYGISSEELRNAYGVCLMRTGELAKAVEAYRDLVIDRSGVCLKPEAPAVFKTNFATALLLTNNVSGCLSVLKEVGPAQHPAVIRLRAAIARWRCSLGWRQRIAFALYGKEPGKPVLLDGPPT